MRDMNEMHNILLHEIGEIQAGQLLGEQWEQLISDLPQTQAELMLRAVRDHLADSISTLPSLLQNMHKASIHFYFANLTNMRKYLYPGLLTAYDKWQETGNETALQNTLLSAQKHWSTLAEKILDIYQKNNQPQKQIETLIESSRL